ncbi:hypothetical protein [Fictibacillus fluitans]|uniref:ABC transporter permease n=1 Tax=Fictibacillus fluitans TaxID=3058422 RepID=A0ABT8HTI0_9BACL|nr:hypothetical protein [Fictibacillus sp. NE201]MDN4524029.1 hypothetical protein [Fictibacillus sp. NE201]
MFNFMKLEMKKHRLKGLIRGVISANIVILALITVIFFAEKSNRVIAFPDYTTLLAAIHSFIRPTMLMFTGVLLVRLIIDEGRNKTMSLMFMYPVTRSKVMLYKSVMVFAFGFLTIVLSNVICGAVVILVNPAVGFVSGPFDLSTLSKFFMQVLIDGLIIGGMALLPMYIGIRKFSVPATLVTTAILVILLLTQLGGSIPVLVSLSIIGLIAAFLAVRKINVMDM